MQSSIPRLAHIGREILKNTAMGSALVQRMRGNRAHYQDLAATLEAVQRTATFYDEHLSAYCGTAEYAVGKKVFEIGPGAHLGLTLWFLARGAVSATAVDRFYDVLPSPELREVHAAIAALWPSEMQHAVRELIEKPREAFERGDARLRYHQVPLEDAAARVAEHFDIAFSYGVLGLVEDLDDACAGLFAMLAPGGVMVHRVHHGTHGQIIAGHAGMLHQYTYGPRVWQWMYSHRGGPNRLPASAYMEACKRAGFVDITIKPVQQLSEEEVELNRPLLHPAFRTRSTQDLATHVSALLARRPA